MSKHFIAEELRRLADLLESGHMRVIHGGVDIVPIRLPILLGSCPGVTVESNLLLARVCNNENQASLFLETANDGGLG